MKNNEVILHGECTVFVSEIPVNAKRKNVNGFLVVAPSETTGNDHVVDAVEGVDFYENAGRLYMNSMVPTQIRCLHANRHDAIEIPAGTYEFGSQLEYDPFTARMNAVRD